MRLPTLYKLCPRLRLAILNVPSFVYETLAIYGPKKHSMYFVEKAENSYHKGGPR